MSDAIVYYREFNGEVWEFTSVPGASLWPAGDPCPNDREVLVTLRRVDKDAHE